LGHNPTAVAKILYNDVLYHVYAASTLNEWQFCALVGGFDVHVFNSTSHQVSDPTFLL